MKIAYPAFIKKSMEMYAVYIPDFDGFTEGRDLCDAIEMAREYIGNAIVGPLGDGDNRPDASNEEQARNKARKADEWFYDASMTYIDVDVEAHRATVRNVFVKKNCTLPYWLERKAEAAGVNFSQVLQEALKEKLGVA